MTQQITNRRLAGRFTPLTHQAVIATAHGTTGGAIRNNIGTGGGGCHFQIGKFRHVHGDRIIKTELAIFIEHHQGHASDRLRHGVNSINRIIFHWTARLAVSLTIGLLVDNFAVAHDYAHATDHGAIINFSVHKLGDFSQPLR